jgi:hypothetical protein
MDVLMLICESCRYFFSLFFSLKFSSDFIGCVPPSKKTAANR